MLLSLFVLIQLATLAWWLSEIILSVRLAKRLKRPMSFLMPGVAFLFFAESVFLDIYLLSQARM